MSLEKFPGQQESMSQLFIFRRLDPVETRVLQYNFPAFGKMSVCLDLLIERIYQTLE